MGKHRHWNRLPYYLRAFQAIAEQNDLNFSFVGRHSLEIGAGQVLGFAPFAIVEGGAAVSVLDPAYVELRENQNFQRQYLYPLYCMHSRLSGAVGPRDFESFMDRIMRIEARACGLEQLAPSPERYDLLLSKSCLACLPDIDRAVDACYDVSTTGSLHFHYIDFTPLNALDVNGMPFGTMYQQSRDSNPVYFKNPRGELNLLRASDFVAAFRRRFSKVHFSVLTDCRAEKPPNGVHSDWAHYSAEDLNTANGVLLAVK
jgi:hypothetical protein